MAAPVKPETSENFDPTPPRGGLPFPASDRTRGLLRLIADGGVIEGSQRDLAQRVGMSRTTFTRFLGELEASGHVVVTADKLAGTRIALRAA